MFKESEAVCEWSYCYRKLKSQSQALYHVKYDHIQSKETQCQWTNCKSKSTSRSNLINHLYKHISVIEGICYLCQKTFKRTADFKKHIHRHTGQERQFNGAVDLLFK